MCAVLQHPKTVLTVLAGIEVVVLQTVHLPVSLGAAGADGTHKWSITLFGLFNRHAQIYSFVNREIALTLLLMVLEPIALLVGLVAAGIGTAPWLVRREETGRRERRVVWLVGRIALLGRRLACSAGNRWGGGDPETSNGRCEKHTWRNGFR